MTIAHNLGFPRIGARRELKKAVEAYWSGNLSAADLRATGKELRIRHWQQQQQAGIDLIPAGDFAFYDQMLNMTALLGAIPARFGFQDTGFNLDQYFALARGTPQQPAMEMTKWFDTNYHYIVPEFHRDTVFRLGCDWLFDELSEAQSLGISVKPVLIGPLTYLYLGKEKEGGFSRLELLPRLLPVYREILARMKEQGVFWVQIDEPVLTLDLPQAWVNELENIYAQLSECAPNILFATYFDSVAEHAKRLKALPVAGVHIDAIRAPHQVAAFVENYPTDRILSLGIVDGRNIWRCNLAQALNQIAAAREVLGDRLWIAPSCSLLHVPTDLAFETKLDGELKSWLAFAVQKLGEVAALKLCLLGSSAEIVRKLDESSAALMKRAASPRIFDPQVRKRLAKINQGDVRRHAPFADRIKAQRECLKLPSLPTTTIGSFPQTPEIRQARADFKQGRLSEDAYREKMRAEIKLAVSKQEEIGLDVLVHGEAERNDMVEYFGEQLSGFAFTENGWVQSYGSRCVKPPVIYGDVSRPQPMTVEWSAYAQSLTQKPMKGMLTGPVTILQWSFVRDDQPRSATAMQIALAIGDEVRDLEQAGISAIQIDEPAIREGLPLKRRDWQHYLDWAVKAFQLCSSGVRDDTQIHTHMCYSEFNDILPAIVGMDADVITIETSRSDMELLDAFSHFKYPNDIGPGVYDIHSPRVPDIPEMVRLLEQALTVIPAERLWVNPDCGLKTRGWPEVEAALKNMVKAAEQLRVRAAGAS